MSGAVNWKFSFEGLDAGLAKLREINALLDSISKKQANFNLNGNNRSSNTNVPNEEERVNGSGAGVAAGAAAGAAEGAGISNAGKKIKTSLDNIVIDFGKADEELKKQLDALYGRHRHPDSPASEIRRYSSPIGPVQPISTLQKLKDRFANINKGTFAETLSGSSNKFVSAIGNVSQGFNLLKSVAIELYVVFEALKLGVKLVLEGIKYGSDAYKRGAKFGNPIGKQNQLDNAFEAIGIESPDLSQLQGQFNKKSGKYEAPGTDVILGAARAGQFGNAQQLTNMAEEFRYAMNDGAQSAKQMEGAARATFYESMEISNITREWKTLLAQIATVLFPLIEGVLVLIKLSLEQINAALGVIIGLAQLLHVLPQGGSLNDPVKIGGTSQKESVTSFGRMGFIIPGVNSNGPEQQLNDINRNTRDTVSKLSLVVAALAAIGTGDGTVLLPLQNYP